MQSDQAGDDRDGTARMALLEWGNPGGERIDERGLTLTPDWLWVTFSRLLGPPLAGALVEVARRVGVMVPQRHGDAAVPVGAPMASYGLVVQPMSRVRVPIRPRSTRRPLDRRA